MSELKTTTDRRRTKGLLGTPNDELRLRIHGSKREGQVVVVRVPKCTVGSAKSCNLPLQGPGVQPIHCLILRGQRGSVVRCLAPGTTLNGMQIRDATLFTGDRLRIGPFELEVLPTTATNKAFESHHPRTLRSDANNEIAATQASWNAHAATMEVRINRLEGQLSDLQGQHGDQTGNYEAKVQEIKLAQDAIFSLSRQLECERERHGSALESLIGERDRLASELAEATHAANDLCRELDQVRNDAFHTDTNSELHRQQVSDLFETNARQVAEVSAEVGRLADQLAETGQQHQKTRELWQANKEALEQRLAESVRQLTRLEQELADVRRLQEDAATQRHLNETQAAELKEAVQNLKEQIAVQQRNQTESQNNWAAERQTLDDKLQRLEEQHLQAATLQQSIASANLPAASTQLPLDSEPPVDEQNILPLATVSDKTVLEERGSQDIAATDVDAQDAVPKQLPAGTPTPLSSETPPPNEPQAAATASIEELPAETTFVAAGETLPQPDGGDLLTIADLNHQPSPESAGAFEPGSLLGPFGPQNMLHLESDVQDNAQDASEDANQNTNLDKKNDKVEHQALVSRLDQLKASRVAAEQQQEAERPPEYRPYEMFNDLGEQTKQPSLSLDDSRLEETRLEETSLEELRLEETHLEETGALPATNLDEDCDSKQQIVEHNPDNDKSDNANLDNDTPGEGAPRTFVSERDQLFDRLNAPQHPQPSANATDSNKSIDLDVPPSNFFESQIASANPADTGLAADTIASMGIDMPQDAESDNTHDDEDAGAALNSQPGPFEVPSVPTMEDAALIERTSSGETGAPVTAAEVLSRMGQLGEAAEETPGGYPANSTTSETHETGMTSAATTEIADDDESIEAYMNQLLARTRGTSEPQPVAQLTRSTVESSWGTTPEEPPSADGEPTEYLPRSQAPEQSSNLSAMRELANDSARSAIATYAKSSGFDLAMAKMIAAAGAVAASGIALYYYGSTQPLVTFLGVATGLSAAAYWTWQAFAFKRSTHVPARNVTPASIGAAHQLEQPVEEVTTPQA